MAESDMKFVKYFAELCNSIIPNFIQGNGAVQSINYEIGKNRERAKDIHFTMMHNSEETGYTDYLVVIIGNSDFQMSVISW